MFYFRDPFSHVDMNIYIYHHHDLRLKETFINYFKQWLHATYMLRKMFT